MTRREQVAMKSGTARRRRVLMGTVAALAVGALALGSGPGVAAQQAPGGRGGRGGRGGAPPTAEAAAPADLTGYWVSIVTEDWRWRMVTPEKGDYTSVPLNQEGIRVTNAWDPAKDEAAGEVCKAYGAGGIMRVPGRLHITWADPNTLQVETDSGMQTRLFHFGGTQPAGGVPTLQGYSVATWPAGGGRGGRGGSPEGGPARTLKVVTTGLQPGYLRKNGVPYSGDAVVTEYLNRIEERDGASWLLVTTIVDDPTYLNQRFLVSSNFKKEADASGWTPTPCSAR